MSKDPSNPYVSRGGLKLRHALDEFKIDVSTWTCADLGASTGGFTDCLLQAGAARVHSLDTAYGEFAWTLRNDPRVVLLERTNALYATPPPEGVHLVVVDLGWTPQRLLVPVALQWLRPGGRIISLVKPHYEDPPRAKAAPKGILSDAEGEEITHRVVSAMPALGARVISLTKSPVLGGSKGKGNAEWLVLLERAD